MSTRKGPGGRREVWFEGHWVPEDSLNLDELRRAQQMTPPIEEPSEPVRTKGRTPTKRQQQIWDAVAEHGSQTAAGKALGVSQGAVQTGLKGFMKAKGIAGPLPGKQHGRPKPVKPVAAREENQAAAPSPSTSSRVEGPPTAPPAHDSNVEPVDADTAAAALAQLEELEALPELPEVELEEVPDDLVAEAHRVGYAQGYAVAVLRFVSGYEDLSGMLRDMASDAADGLMA